MSQNSQRKREINASSGVTGTS
uniref:Uncharacterized protein n=1 Tax=Arundo donax TaxID=35708 RepID=A0A0A9GXU3_ARUDO